MRKRYRFRCSFVCPHAGRPFDDEERTLQRFWPPAPKISVKMPALRCRYVQVRWQLSQMRLYKCLPLLSIDNGSEYGKTWMVAGIARYGGTKANQNRNGCLLQFERPVQCAGAWNCTLNWRFCSCWSHDTDLSSIYSGSLTPCDRRRSVHGQTASLKTWIRLRYVRRCYSGSQTC